MNSATYWILLIFVLILSSIAIYYFWVKSRRLRKEFLKRYGVAFDDSRALTIVQDIINNSKRDVLEEIKESLNPSASDCFSLLRYWDDRVKKVKEKEEEVERLEFLAKRFHFLN